MVALTIELIALSAWAGGSTNIQPKSLGYVLQADKLTASRMPMKGAALCLANSGRDWIIIDTAARLGEEYSLFWEWTKKDIATIKAGKRNRKVLAYQCIGEGELNRSYWNRYWDIPIDGTPDKDAPKWLCERNHDYKSNYKIRYWDIEWQKIALNSLDQIILAGFDGVCLDTADAYRSFEYDAASKKWIDNRLNPETGNSYRDDMISLVLRLSAHAREKMNNFLIVPQNGLPLLTNDEYLASVDAILVENLFTKAISPQKQEIISHNLIFLNKVKMANKPVLVVEYATTNLFPVCINGAKENGFILLLTDPQLNILGDSGEPGIQWGKIFGKILFGILVVVLLLMTFVPIIEGVLNEIRNAAAIARSENTPLIYILFKRHYLITIGCIVSIASLIALIFIGFPKTNPWYPSKEHLWSFALFVVFLFPTTSILAVLVATYVEQEHGHASHSHTPQLAIQLISLGGGIYGITLVVRYLWLAATYLLR